jgi:hypothetical protein
MRDHIDVLGRLHGVWGAFGLLTGMSLGVLAAGSWLSLASLGTVGHAGRTAVAIFVVSGLALVVSGLAMIATGRAVRAGRAHGRAAALALAVPNLVLVPFGTALGVYTLWVLLNDDARRVFGRPPRVASTVPTSMEEDL